MVRHFDWFDNLTTSMLSAGKLTTGRLPASPKLRRAGRTGNRDFFVAEDAEW
jgi:hypothetical protein